MAGDEDLIDLAVVLQAAGRVVAARVVQDLAERHVRESDGYVFQHLLVEPLPVTELAGRLGITQQATSKAVADMEARGLVRRVVDPGDARVRLVEMAPPGLAAVAAGRRSRAAIVAELTEAMGPLRIARLRRDLDAVLAAMGDADVLRGRRLQPPR
jgi:DNA-binding MarR family transcriptional regulator